MSFVTPQTPAFITKCYPGQSILSNQFTKISEETKSLGSVRERYKSGRMTNEAMKSLT
jgi:hypothetical protein